MVANIKTVKDKVLKPDMEETAYGNSSFKALILRSIQCQERINKNFSRIVLLKNQEQPDAKDIEFPWSHAFI